MLLTASFSELLGYTSIACWLGAQFPQVLENIRNQSVEGLALPFLINWLLGDTTNLIGCILTHQLPFQTYLATYFVFVDFSLFSQYIYYTARAKKESRTPYLHSRERTAGSLVGRRTSLDRGPGAPHYRALSNVAANVAAAAALAAHQEEQTRWLGRSRSSEPHASAYDDDDDVSEDALARLADSFHSEGGRSARRKHIAWGQAHDAHPGAGARGASVGRSRQSSRMPPSALQMTAPLEGSVDSLARGRSLVRAEEGEGEEEWLSSNAARRSSRASRKSATMVFMGVWALFGIGAFSGGRPSFSTGLSNRSGKVLARADVPPLPPSTLPVVGLDAQSSDLTRPAQHAEGAVVYEFLQAANLSSFQDPEPGPTMEHIIGRISAWICTTLYLTSRLPQIWKNYARKSVEGLSVYLFIFAFLGNFFYVASILTSPEMGLPEPQASAFLRESIPYLLGSGGTLMFDVAIVTQSILYRSKAGHRGRKASRSYNEEEAALLSGEATGAEESPTVSRRRGGSISRDTGL